MMRIARYLAQAGVASRRAAELYIEKGLVTVNGEIVRNLATRVDETRDVVRYRGKELAPETLVYYLLHKPVGYVCSAKDPHEKKLVTQLVPEHPRVYPVGRLDKNTSGLLVLTNDGDIALQLSHPRHAVAKTYKVLLDRPYTPELLARLKRGVRLMEGSAAVDAVKVRTAKRIEIVIHQGWNRQIRRMLAACGYSALGLQRISEGKLVLGTLEPGEYRKITREELVV